MKSTRDECPILLVAGVGGHGEQMKRLRSKLTFKNVSIIAEPGLHWEGDRFYYIGRVVDYHSTSKLKIVFRFVFALLASIRIMFAVKPRLVISTGPALAVPVCLVAKLFCAKVVHIESWSRIKTISNTTKLLMKFKLADLIVFQYPEHILSGVKNCEYWGHL